ncbi:MAG TPA: pyrroloquinoline quinone biosynthesis peptide chaperone PqqD [Candidatus Binataceae bacterium]|jgi:pyrroloquinoline quinone biosynthesis protein D|nr:pyrroloquinoline quinone biosynthesis peptide chaperone PqqD [Candidatus Binataceae bacterium]
MAVRLVSADVPVIPARCRLQWEAAQQAYVILYPEGMVKLSASAGEIMKRIDGRASIAEVIRSLEQAFPGADLRADVIEFLNAAYARGWIEVPGR